MWGNNHSKFKISKNNLFTNDNEMPPPGTIYKKDAAEKINPLIRYMFSWTL
jgi:hypothetical protein